MRDWRIGGGGMVLCEKERERAGKGGVRLQHFGKRFTKFFFFFIT
jgi:hypothetical protein